MIRFLTYCNQWEEEGPIATTSIHQKQRVAPESIMRALDAYGKVQPNLLLHEKGYPTAAAVYKKVHIYRISDQDDSGPWIRKTFPSMFFVVSPGYNYAHASWLGMSFPMPWSDTPVTSNEWLARNIQQGHGPM